MANVEYQTARKRGVEESVDVSQDMNRIAKRAGRINTAPTNVGTDEGGRRFLMSQNGPRLISSMGTPHAGTRTAAPDARQANIAAAKANGSFAQTRYNFNQTNSGKATMDDAGNIVKVPSTPKESTPPPTSDSKPANKPASPNSGPRPEGLIDGKPASRFFQEAANRQGRANRYGTIQPKEAPAPSPAPTPAPAPSATPSPSPMPDAPPSPPAAQPRPQSDLIAASKPDAAPRKFLMPQAPNTKRAKLALK